MILFECLHVCLSVCHICADWMLTVKSWGLKNDVYNVSFEKPQRSRGAASNNKNCEMLLSFLLVDNDEFTSA